LTDANDITESLAALSRGDPAAVEKLLPVVYKEMRRLAAGYLRKERPGHTLQPTALAHEAFLRLVVQKDIAWQSRAHFLGVAAQAMRRILVDHARRRKAARRGGGATVLSLDDAGSASPNPVAFDDLDRALVHLERLSERQAKVVELRYFGGLTIEETAEVLGVSPITVKRDWTMARAGLYRELSGESPKSD
jgi:RNA polymerase sigma factor (TIGR02999 family)